ADKSSITDCEGKPHALIIGVAQTEREPAAGEAGFQIHHAEHFHAVRCGGVFIPHHTDVAKAERFNQCVDHFDVWNRFEGVRARWYWKRTQLRPADLLSAAMGDQNRL